MRQKTAAELHLASAGMEELPYEWQVIEINDLLTKQRGVSVGVMYPGDHDPTGIPLIKAGDLSGSIINSDLDFCITPEKHQEYCRTELEGGEILLVLVGDVGQCAVVPPAMKGWNAARAIAVIRLKDPSDAHYVRICLMSRPLRHLMYVWSNTTVQATLNLKEVRQLPLPWPPKSIRDSIAEIFMAFDRKIELNRQMNQILEAMAQAIFQSWFVDFEPVKAKQKAKAAGKSAAEIEMAAIVALSGKSEEAIGELSAAVRSALSETAGLFGDELVESELSLIPEGWEVSQIGKEVEIVGGGTPSTQNSEFWDNGHINWVTPKDLSNLSDKVLLSTSRKITEQGLAKISSGLLPPNTILMSSRAPVGYLVITQIETAINQGFIAMKCNKCLPSEYVLLWADSNMEKIKQMASGSTFAEINKATFRPFLICVPPSEILNLFAKKVRPIYQKIASNNLQSISLATIRDALLPRLLSGEINVEGVKND
jgi:type I restriction enzyme, S subunit